jgi:tetratricopeptide (TPR) repeat protein
VILIRLIAAVATAATSAPAQAVASYYRDGLEAFRQGRAEEALHLLERAVSVDARHAPSWKVIGVIRAIRGDYAESEPAFREACKWAPELPDACFYHARSLYLLNRFQDALTGLEALPSDNRRFRIQALCVDALGRWSEAEPLYRKAIASGAPGEDARIDFGVALARQGKANEAVPFLELAVQEGKEPGRSELELGRVLLQLERLPEARLHLERAAALSPGTAQTHLLLGRIYKRLGMEAKALEHLLLGAAATK